MGQQHYRRWAGEVNTRPAGPNDHLTRETKAQKTDYSARIDSALTALTDAVEAYQNDNGKTEIDIQNAKNEIIKAEQVLREAQEKLKALQSLGSVEDRYSNSVTMAERELQNLVGHYTQEVEAEIIRGFYGQDVPRHALGAERKSELKLHKRISDLKRFSLVPIKSSTAKMANHGVFVEIHDVKKIDQRVDIVGQKLTDLKQHIEKDGAK